jgi:CPA2 family monovalent cation:H+ antiporter-2
VSLGLLPVEGQSLVLAGALISISANSALFAAIEPLQIWIRNRSAIARRVERPDDPLAQLPMSTDLRLLTGQVVIVGYGRVGKRIGMALREKNIPFVVAEQNREIVDALRQEGLPAVSGDASIPDVLIQAHIARAAMLVIAIPDMVNVRPMVEIARTLNPSIAVVLRTHNEEEADMFARDGLGAVFVGEHELARGMTGHILDTLKKRG